LVQGAKFPNHACRTDRQFSGPETIGVRSAEETLHRSGGTIPESSEIVTPRSRTGAAELHRIGIKSPARTGRSGENGKRALQHSASGNFQSWVASRGEKTRTPNILVGGK